MLDVRYSHLYFYQSLNRLQRGLSAIAELLVRFNIKTMVMVMIMMISIIQPTQLAVNMCQSIILLQGWKIS